MLVVPGTRGNGCLMCRGLSGSTVGIHFLGILISSSKVRHIVDVRYEGSLGETFFFGPNGSWEDGFFSMSFAPGIPGFGNGLIESISALKQ